MDVMYMRIYILYAHMQRVNANFMAARSKTQIDWKAVGRRIRELRGYDTHQAQFAAELGVSQGQLSRYEQGNSEVGAEVLLRLSRISRKSIEWILTGEGTV
jgi:DNA-binding transcriptional regulator YiaG